MESVKPINYSKLIRLKKTLSRLVFNRRMTEILKFNVIYFGNGYLHQSNSNEPTEWALPSDFSYFVHLVKERCAKCSNDLYPSLFYSYKKKQVNFSLIGPICTSFFC